MSVSIRDKAVAANPVNSRSSVRSLPVFVTPCPAVETVAQVMKRVVCYQGCKILYYIVYTEKYE